MAPHPQHRTRVVFVVQRYGQEIIGGAESLARQLCEQLVQTLGWEVDVFTTTAGDYTTWANQWPSGSYEIAGVRVHRFPVVFRRTKLFSVYNHATSWLLKALRKMPLLHHVCRYLERLWILLQGPVCPELVSTLAGRQSEYDFVIAMTYLYYPSLEVLRQLGPQCVLIPTAHDEHPFHFLTVRDAVRSARALAVLTDAEARLIRRVTGDDGPQIVQGGVGLTVAPRPAAQRPSRYLVYLGRISRGKSVDQLISWFSEGQAAGRIPADLALHLIGQREEGFPATPHAAVKFLGTMDEQAKNAHIAGAFALVNPSAHESLSMIVLEAMAMKVPAVVNGASDVLADYARQTDSVFAYRSKEEFFTCCDKVVTTDWESGAGAQALNHSKDWVLQRYSWENVLRTFSELAEQFR